MTAATHWILIWLEQDFQETLWNTSKPYIISPGRADHVLLISYFFLSDVKMKSDLLFTLMCASEYPCGNKYHNTLGFSAIGCLVVICDVLRITMDLYIILLILH